MEMNNENWGNIQSDHESRRDRFERLGRSRMRRTLNTIRLLGNLATPNYQWTESDISKMEKALREQIDKTFSKFKKVPREKNDLDFDFTSH